MSVHADILHLAVAGAGVVIVAGLSVPSFVELSKRSKLFKSNGYGTVSGFYEDQDGEATEGSTQNYSDTWPRLLTWLSATLGLAASIVAGILANETDSFVSAAASFQSILSSWSDLAAWAFIFSQCVFLPRRGQYLAKYGLAIYGLLSAIVLTCSLVYRNKFAYLVTSRRDSRVLGLGICWLLQVAAAVAVAFSLAAIPRRPDVYFKGKLVDQQYTVSILSKMAFSWNDIVFQISKERQLEMTDLPRLDFVTRSRNLYTHFTARNDQGRLWWRLVKFHSVQLAQQWSLVLVSSLLALFPQYVLYNFLERLESPRIPGQGKIEIWAWALGLCFALGLQVVVNGLLSWWTTSRLMLPLGSVLQSLVFHKALNQHEAAAPAVKTEDDDESKYDNDPKSKPKDKEKKTDDIRQSVINHMKLDSGRVTMFCNFNYYFPLALVKLILAGGFLMKLLGWKAVVAGLLSAALVIPVSHWMSKKYAKIQFGLMKYRDGKAHLLTEALQGMRQIKYSALEQYWEDKILKSRNEELGQYWKVSLMMCLVILVINMGPLLLACVALSIYAFEQGPNIRASVIFASLGLFDQLDEAVALLPMLQVYLMEAWTSCVRLENYFNQPDKAPVAIEGEAITFEEATVAWPKAEEKEGEGEPQEERSMLRDITLEFPAGELSVITGKTGSGKSLLLAAILGEVKLLSGTVKVPTPPPEKDDEIDFIADAEWIIPSLTSFVSQTPWIETGTVKENITFGLPLSEVRYRKVLKACSLEKDIELLVDGDKTEVGPKGVTLSGGQRWRVALARALYSRAGVLILDDVLSAVDAHVGRIIVDEALTGELARGRTRILATHHAEMVLPRSSYLVRLHDGKVENAEAITQSDDTRTISSDTAESANQELSETSTAVDAQESHTSDDTLGATDSPSKGKKTDDDEKRETGRVKWRIYKIYLQASNAPFLWTFAALCIIASGFATVGRTWTLKELSEDHSTESINMSTYTGFDDTRLFLQNPHAATIHVDRPSHHSIAFWIGLSVLFYILVILMVVGRAFFMIIIGLRASKVLFERMTHAVLRAPLRWVDTIPSGRILNRFTSDTFMVDRRLSGELGNFLQTVFSLVVVIAASLSVSMYVLIAGVLLFLFYGQIASQYITVAREVKRLNSISHSPIYDQFSSVLSGLSTIRAFRRSNFYMGRMFTLIDNSNKASWALNLSGRWMNFRMGMLGTVFVTVVAIAVSVGGVDAALAGFSLTFALRYTGRLTSLLQAMTSIELGFNAAERVVEYAEIETEPEDGKDAPAAWPTDGRIEVENLTVSYKDSLPPVLKNLNFEVKAGERIGIVGRTGAGKSTLASVFFRLLSPKEGSIRIDNIDIATLKLKDLRSRLAIIPQDPFLFSGTLRSNLDIEGLKDDYDLQTILQRVHLVEPQGADPERPSQYTPSNAVQETLISTTEVDPAASADNANPVPDLENLNTAPAATTTTEQEVNNETDSRDIFKDLSMSISTGGANLSQGQRQLVCLARSLLGRPKIVVLDEATSAVDRATDAAIQESLRAEFAAAGCTVLVIAHRLSTVADFDKILVLKAGRVAEMGTPEELLRAGMEKEKAAGSRAATEEEGAAQAADEEEEDEDGKGAFWELVQKSAEKDKLVEMILGNQEAAS